MKKWISWFEKRLSKKINNFEDDFEQCRKKSASFDNLSDKDRHRLARRKSDIDFDIKCYEWVTENKN